MAEQKKATAESKYLKLKSSKMDIENNLKKLTQEFELLTSDALVWKGAAEEAYKVMGHMKAENKSLLLQTTTDAG